MVRAKELRGAEEKIRKEVRSRIQRMLDEEKDEEESAVKKQGDRTTKTKLNKPVPKKQPVPEEPTPAPDTRESEEVESLADKDIEKK